MQKRSIVAPVCGGIALISMLAACEKSPTRPAPPLNGTPTVRRLEVSGPDTIAPGARANYKLTSFLSDGTSRDVTAEAIWRSSNAATATIDQSGVATGGAMGETQISASISPNSSTKSVAVMPEGTFKLAGSVVEEGSNLRIVLAQVEVRDQTGLLLRTTTIFDGSFSLLGVPSDAELLVTRDGYVAHTQRLHLSENTTIQVPLKLAAPGPNLSGTYTLTVGAPQCPGSPPHVGIPEELRQRTYTAVVTHVGSKVDVTLTGAQFATVAGRHTNSFTGRVQGTRVSFMLYGIESQSYYYYSSVYGPDVAERLADGTAIVPSGSAELTISGNRWDGTLNGNLRHVPTVPSGAELGRCSGSIPLTFTK